MTNFVNNLLNELNQMNDSTYVCRVVMKNNGVELHGIQQDISNGISPVIYAEDFYDMYKQGKDITQIATEIMDLITDNSCSIDTSILSNPEYILKNVYPVLVSTQTNATQLTELCHKEFLDMSIIYKVKVDVPASEGEGSYKLTTQMLQLLAKHNINIETIHEAALANMERTPSTQMLIMSMSNAIANLMDVDSTDIINDTDIRMYILTNKSMCHGAVYMISTDALQQVADKMGCEHIIILPSSVHEIIAVPYDTISCRDLADMVEVVNTTEVDPTEVLSYSVYEYDTCTKEVKII